MQPVKPIDKNLVQTDRHRRILAIVGDTQVGLWLVRSLARNGLEVHAIVNSPKGQAAHSRYSTSAWLLTNSPKQTGFTDEIIELCQQLEVGSIMPVSEGYHRALIKVRDRLNGAHIHLFSPSQEAFAKSTNKDFMQQLCEELGIPVAKGMRLDTLIREHQGKTLNFPLVLRTSQQNIDAGKAPWKAAYANSHEMLQKLYAQVKDYADNIIVQEYHPGVEDHVQILMHNQKLVQAGDYIGEHHMPLAGGVTVQRVSCHHPSLIADSVKLLQAIHFEGIAGVQFHYDPATDKYIFLEINPRFSGGLPTVIMAGFQAPFRLWQTHFEPDKIETDPYQLGLKTRILGGDANWLLGQLRKDELPPDQKHLHPLAAIGSFMWNCGPWTKDDSFLLTDPKPFFIDFKQMLFKLGARGHDIIGNPQ